MSSLSEEQKRKIEENKRKALERRAEKQSHGPSTVKMSQQSRTAGVSLTSTANKPSVALKTNTVTSSFKSSSSVFPNKPSLSKQYNIHQVPSSSSSSGQFGTIHTIKGKCVLISKERFKVTVGYHVGFIEYCKTITSKSYDTVSKTWSFHLEDYEGFIRGTKAFQPDVVIEGLPVNVVKILQANNRQDCTFTPDLSSVDKVLVGTLLPFQLEGVKTAINRNGRILIADDMGLGKTLQAICIACYYRKEWPLLVVSPSSVRFDWAQQICKWLPSVHASEINVVESGKTSATQGLVNILSYDLLAKKAEQLKRYMFRVIIMDESHFLKNLKAVRTKAALPLLKNAKRVLLLSGTPALSRPSELFVQVTTICPDLFKFHDFGLRYCDAKQHQWGWDYSGSSNMQELQIILEAKVMIRRLKTEVLTQLPEKTRQMVVLDPSAVKGHKELKQLSSVMGKGRLKGMEKRGVLLQYFHETCRAKLAAVRDYVIDLMESEKKFLVFAHHREMLDAIEDCVNSQGSSRNYIRIDGDTTSEQRNYFCGQFQSSESHRVAILSITAANAGLNLSAASIVVFAELFWNPGILMQAEDRAHRLGQKDSVSVQYLVAQGTADDYVWPLIQDKLSVLGKAGLSKDNFSDTDTRCMQDSKLQTILDMFKSDFIDEGSASTDVADKLLDGGSNRELAHKSGGQSVIHPSPSKRQASITQFFPTSPPKKQAKVESMPNEEPVVADIDLDPDLDSVDWDDDF